MQLSRNLLVWLVATAAAVVIASIAVQAVTSPQPVPILTVGEPGTPTTDDDDPADDRSPRATPDDNPTPSASPTPHATPDDNPTPRASPSGNPTPSASPSGSPTSHPTTDQGVTRTATSVGGSAAFRFDGRTIEVLWSTPESGFRVEIHRDGPDDVDVRFVANAHESRIKADNEHGSLRIRVDERPRD